MEKLIKSATAIIFITIFVGCSGSVNQTDSVQGNSTAAIEVDFSGRAIQRGPFQAPIYQEKISDSQPDKYLTPALADRLMNPMLRALMEGGTDRSFASAD